MIYNGKVVGKEASVGIQPELDYGDDEDEDEEGCIAF